MSTESMDEEDKNDSPSLINLDPCVDWKTWPNEIEIREHPHSVEISVDRLTAKYIGKGNHLQDVGSVRANRSVPPNVGIYYFEIQILDAGLRGSITIGFTPEGFPLTREAGSSHGSYGYRGDDGRKLFGASGRGHLYGPVFTAPDVVGAGYNLFTNEIFFTKNGENLGVAFQDVFGVLFPTISLHSPNESIRVNWGARPFLFPIHPLRQACHQAQLQQIQATPLCVGTSGSDPSMTAYLRDYLVAAGYQHTLQALDATCDLPLATPHPTSTALQAASLPHRARLRGLVLSGQVQRVIDELQQSGLPVSATVLCHLHSLRFIQLVTQQQGLEAIVYAQQHLLADFFASHQQMISEVMGLLAYQDLSQCPPSLVTYLQPDYPCHVVHLLNQSILELEGSKADSVLEGWLRELVAYQEVSRQLQAGLGLPFSLQSS
eukprot:TRINITY_DN8697_c0_g1_i7.p1 TRINITY_DN8697_c0_g1~~TRINITY_DN8697_c0_g1_i7.p1  ORF type:complete len:456 (-),score=77.30 TRINITY_DN8697_c0_g1_i7:140-1438(-)